MNNDHNVIQYAALAAIVFDAKDLKRLMLAAQDVDRAAAVLTRVQVEGLSVKYTEHMLEAEEGEAVPRDTCRPTLRVINGGRT